MTCDVNAQILDLSAQISLFEFWIYRKIWGKRAGCLDEYVWIATGYYSSRMYTMMRGKNEVSPH